MDTGAVLFVLGPLPGLVRMEFEGQGECLGEAAGKGCGGRFLGCVVHFDRSADGSEPEMVWVGLAGI